MNLGVPDLRHANFLLCFSAVGFIISLVLCKSFAQTQQRYYRGLDTALSRSMSHG